MGSSTSLDILEKRKSLASTENLTTIRRSLPNSLVAKQTTLSINFMVTPCINNIQHFNYQLMHTTLKNVELLKHSKIIKTALTCFGLQGNHHQGSTVSTWLKSTHFVKSRYVEAVQNVVSVMAAYCDL